MFLSFGSHSKQAISRWPRQLIGPECQAKWVIKNMGQLQPAFNLMVWPPSAVRWMISHTHVHTNAVFSQCVEWAQPNSVEKIRILQDKILRWLKSSQNCTTLPLKSHHNLGYTTAWWNLGVHSESSSTEPGSTKLKTPVRDKQYHDSG